MATSGSSADLFGLARHSVICGTCREIRGDAVGRFGSRFHQPCSCEPGQEAGVPLAGYDFPTAAELCRCCATVLLESGSKFAVWFCGSCHALVREFNDDAGSYVIPIGRHSFMAGLGIQGRALGDGSVARKFAVAMASWAGRIVWIEAWAPTITRSNLTVLGLATEGDVLLAEYLQRADEYGGQELTSPAAFKRLVAAL